MYAIIESCGKQYKVAQGDVVFFEKLDAEEGKKVTFDKVVLVSFVTFKERKLSVLGQVMNVLWIDHVALTTPLIWPRFSGVQTGVAGIR